MTSGMSKNDRSRTERQQQNLNHQSRPPRAAAAADDGAAATFGTKFGCTPKELKELMEIRGPEAVARIRNKYGTVDEMCKRLLVHPNEGELHCEREI